jgi:hypothetical protein
LPFTTWHPIKIVTERKSVVGDQSPVVIGHRRAGWRIHRLTRLLDIIHRSSALFAELCILVVGCSTVRAVSHDPDSLVAFSA